MRRTSLITLLMSASIMLSVTACTSHLPNSETLPETEQITQQQTADQTQTEGLKEKEETTESETLVDTETETPTITETEIQTETETETNSETESEDISVNEEYSETYTETETESESQTSEQTEEMVLAEDFVSLCDYRTAAKKIYNFSGGKEYAFYFELPEGASLLSFYFQSVSGEDSNSNIHISIYKTAKLAPTDTAPPNTDEDKLVYSETVTSIPFNTYQVYFEKGRIGSGSYLIKLTSPDEDGIYNDTVFVGKGWDRYLPKGYEEYNFQTFADGKKQQFGLYGGIVIEHYVPKSSIGELNEEVITNKIEGEKIAKVIVLSGQSNAAGATPYSHLQKHVSPEKYEEYLNGYSNVKIIYSSAAIHNGQIDIQNISDTFVNTRLGQGYVPSYLGPEVGLAEYLNETYPDETFYIIKYGVGSASLSGYFNPTDPEKSACLTALKEKMQLGLKLLEEDGYTPKIVAFLWMQGESDANTISGTYPYYDLQKTMVEQIRNEFSSYAPERGIAFIDAGISDHGTWATSMLMNALKKKFAYESRANYYVDTVKAGLVTLTEDENTDQYHYVSTSVIELGRLFGEKVSEHID